MLLEVWQRPSCLPVLYAQCVCCLKSAHSSSVVAWFALLGQAKMESSTDAGGFIQAPTCLFKNLQHPIYSIVLLPSNQLCLERE